MITLAKNYVMRAIHVIERGRVIDSHVYLGWCLGLITACSIASNHMLPELKCLLDCFASPGSPSVFILRSGGACLTLFLNLFLANYWCSRLACIFSFLVLFHDCRSAALVNFQWRARICVCHHIIIH